MLQVLEAMAQAVACQASGDLAQARQHYQRVLALQPEHPDALRWLGCMALEEDRCAEAIALLDRAVAARAQDPELHNHAGCARMAARRWEQALACFERALTLAPGEPRFLANRATALHRLRRMQEALVDYEAAIARAPATFEPYVNRGVALQALRRWDEAMASYAQAQAIDPRHPDVYMHRGAALYELGRFADALAQYEQALACAPGHSKTQFNKSLILMLMGDWQQGMPLYEARWKAFYKLRPFSQPLWLGGSPLVGCTLLLHSDQGIGDTLMYARLAGQVIARGARVVMEVHRVLVPLLRGLEGVSEVLALGQPLPPFDCHTPLCSLPLALGLAPHTLPGAAPYLQADPLREAAWAQWLGPKRRLRVGLAWSGNPEHSNDAARSIALETFVTALPEGCDYVCLQKPVRDSDLPALRARPWIRDCTAGLHDFSEAAALCAHMDLVITVDTSIAHLGGALGRPTWVLLPFPPDHRWLLDRDDSPWYGSVRLFRQGRDHDWAPVLARVRAQLARLLAQGGAASDGAQPPCLSASVVKASA